MEFITKGNNSEKQSASTNAIGYIDPELYLYIAYRVQCIINAIVQQLFTKVYISQLIME